MHDPNRDYWDRQAVFMELTIEGQRLIAQGLVCEMKGLWRRTRQAVLNVADVMNRWRPLPPA